MAAETTAPVAANDASSAAQPAAATPEAAPAANSGNDTQIVITAQKRSENVQKVPISVAAFTGQTLVKANVLNVQDLQRVVPNFQAAKGAQSTYLRLSIRGIGAASNTTVEPSVAVFLDGAYVPRVGSAISSLLDMEGVEVLRGPQGTLFGRNASVGAISFHTAQPKFNGCQRRSLGRSRHWRPLQAHGHPQRAGQRTCSFPLRRFAAVVQRLLAQ